VVIKAKIASISYQRVNLTRWSRVLRDTAASQLNDALRARLRDWALVRVTVCHASIKNHVSIVGVIAWDGKW